MTRTRKTIAIISERDTRSDRSVFHRAGDLDWNRLKPTINQKVSAELNRPFAIRGDLGVVWERQPGERGWRRWIRPHVHAEDIILGNPPDIPQVTMVRCICRELKATLAAGAAYQKTVICRGLSLNSRTRD